jgi:hypothetical protein
MALARADELQHQGDVEGSHVWRQLADEIERGGISAEPSRFDARRRFVPRHVSDAGA